jgi:hypothetical protein
MIFGTVLKSVMCFIIIKVGRRRNDIQ